MTTNNPKIKICGMTNLRDCLQAIEAGADYLGFIRVPESPRHLSPEQVRDIVQALPREIMKVGVFADHTAVGVCDEMDFCGLDIAQLHGDEPAEEACEIGAERVWKMVHLQAPEEVEEWQDYPAALLLADSVVRGRRGGTGVACDWPLVAALSRLRPVILAGGLNPVTVSEAVRLVQPYGVDVCSGVEALPGQKDPEKVRAFIEAIRGGVLANR